MKKVFIAILACAMTVGSSVAAYAAAPETTVPAAGVATADQAAGYLVTSAKVKAEFDFDKVCEMMADGTYDLFAVDFPVDLQILDAKTNTGISVSKTSGDADLSYFLEAKFTENISKKTEIDAKLVLTSTKYNFKNLEIPVKVTLNSDKKTAKKMQYVKFAENEPIELVALKDFDYKVTDKKAEDFEISLLKPFQNIPVLLRNGVTGKVETFDPKTVKIDYTKSFLCDTFKQAETNVVYFGGSVTLDDGVEIPFYLPVKLKFPNGVMDKDRKNYDVPNPAGDIKSATKDSATKDCATKDCATKDCANGAIATGEPLIATLTLGGFALAAGTLFVVYRKRIHK